MYFDDLLDSSDNLMGYDYTEPHKADDTKFLSLKVKAESDGAKIAQSLELKRNKGSYVGKSKTELEQPHGDEWKSKFVSSNKEHELEFDFKPSSMNKDGQKLEVEIDAKCQPAANTWDGELKLSTGGYELGPIKPWMDFKVGFNSKSETKIEYHQNNVMDDYHLGWRMHMDKSNSVSSVWCHAAMIGDNGNYYVRGNALTKLFGLGTWFKSEGGSKHSMEAQYDLNNAQPGFMGMPLYLRYGGAFKFGALDYNCKFAMKEKMMWKDTVKFPLGGNCSVSITSVTDVQDMVMNPDQCKPVIGASFELKL